jgi:hypothetical protein
VGWLRCFRGLNTLSAVILLAEIGDFRFQRPRELVAYPALVPSEYWPTVFVCATATSLSAAVMTHNRSCGFQIG